MSGWLLCPGIAGLVAWLYGEIFVRSGKATMWLFSLVHDQPLLAFLLIGSWTLAHAWLAAVAILTAMGRCRWSRSVDRLQVFIVFTLVPLVYLPRIMGL